MTLEELLLYLGYGFVVVLFTFSFFNVVNKEVEESVIVFEYSSTMQKMGGLLRHESFEELCNETQTVTGFDFMVENIDTGEKCESTGYKDYEADSLFTPGRRLVVSFPKVMGSKVYRVKVYE